MSSDDSGTHTPPYRVPRPGEGDGGSSSSPRLILEGGVTLSDGGTVSVNDNADGSVEGGACACTTSPGFASSSGEECTALLLLLLAGLRRRRA